MLIFQSSLVKSGTLTASYWIEFDSLEWRRIKCACLLSNLHPSGFQLRKFILYAPCVLIEFLIILSICLCITFNFSYDFVLLNGPHSFRLLPLCLELVTVISSLFFTNSEQFYFCTEFPYEIMNYLVFFPDGCVFVYTLIIFPIANFKLL